MKTLNQYINESILDDEEDLVNSGPGEIIRNWLLSHIDLGMSNNYLDKNFDKIFKITGDVVEVISDFPYKMIFTEPLPEYIHDFIIKDDARKPVICINFPIKSQKDIDKFPYIDEIWNQNELKNLIIKCGIKHYVASCTFEDIKKIKNISLEPYNGDECNMNIAFFTKTPIKKLDDLLEIKCPIKAKNGPVKSFISLFGAVVDKLKKECLEIGSQKMEEKYQDILDKIYDNTGFIQISLLGSLFQRDKSGYWEYVK